MGYGGIGGLQGVLSPDYLSPHFPITATVLRPREQIDLWQFNNDQTLPGPPAGGCGVSPVSI